LPDVEPGMSEANRRATYVPADSKPARSGEFNPGGGEYDEQAPTGPGGTETAVGDGNSGRSAAPHGTNHPPAAGT
jgi:hypothetical protein